MNKDYTQIEYIKVMGEMGLDIIKKSPKEGALIAINPIKEKRCGNLKVRTLADDRPQRCYIPKKDVLSPTISLESLFTIIIIESHNIIDV